MHGPSALRRVAALLVPLALAACGGSHGGLAPQPYAPQAIAGAGARVVAARDLGRRDARKPVSVVVQLRYNRTRELERAVEQMADPHSSQFHHFLTKAQFEARYAPSPAQERETLAALRAAGFTIDRRYANRALIDAHAPNATVERTFATEIHDFAQGRFGTRFANVRPVTLPAALARTVASVDVDTVVLKHAFVSALPALALPPGGLQPSGQWGAIANGGFETGKLHPWTACASKTTAPRATVTKLHPFAGTFDALTGTQTSGEPNGLDGICQTVTVPSKKPQLAAFLYQLTNQRASQAGKQLVALFTTAGKPLATLLSAKQNAKAWVAQHWSLQQYAGKKVVVFFGVDGGGESNVSIQQFVDNVTLVSGTPSPSPSPSSSPRPSPTPTARTSPTPTPAGTPAPTPTPGGSLPTGPGTPIAGPTYGPNGGWGPLAVASAFDFPVQHGYDGTGETAAIVIDCAVPPADLSSYLSAYSIVQTGTVTNDTSLGGPASAATCDNDGLEADLDEETIAGLAPGANIIMYLIPSLDNEDIENAYNLAVSDDRAVAVNSSFGGCESQDATFDTQSDATAVEGAAKGITFSASSGDQGSACYTSAGFVFGVNAPASDPHFVAVGGNESDPLDPTQTTDQGINTPAAWNDCTASSSGNSACATGGGISAVWPLPSYQSGVAGSPDSRSDRNVPDIAFPAVYDEIYADGPYSSGAMPTDIVGTSWASPTNVAMLTELAQICQGAGFANQTMYAVFAFGGYSLFTDVTTGNNAYDAPHTKAYHAATGYDNTTGIGMPSAFNLSAAMCGKTPSLRRR